MNQVLKRLAERKVGQWVLAYLGAAWMVLEFVNLIADTWEWTVRAQQGVQVALLLGLPLTILLAWFHGEKGRQRVTGTELVSFAIVVGVGALALSAWADQTPPSVDGLTRRVAVMPLDYPPGDSTLTYVAELLRDEVSAELATYEGIDVISRSTVLIVGESHTSAGSIADRLGLDAVVEGSLSRVDDQISIRVALADPDSELDLTERRFDLSGANLLAGVVDVAAAVAVAVHPHLRVAVGDRRTEVRPVGATAMVPYARARSLLLEASPDAHARARAFIDRAIEADSMWSAPYALLARWYHLGGFFGTGTSSVAEPARRAANRALSLERESSAAFLALSLIQYQYDWDWVAADASLESALELAPQDPDIRIWASTTYAIWGRTAEAIEHGLRSVELDPLSCHALTQLSLAYRLAGRFGEAAASARECLALDPNYDLAYYHLAWAQHGARDTEGARRTAERALSLFGSELPGRWTLFAADIHAHSGVEGRARELLAQALEDGIPAGFEGSLISIFVGLGDIDRAMQSYLREMEERNAPDPLYGLALARLAPLREHPDFGLLLDALNPPATMGLDAYRD